MQTETKLNIWNTYQSAWSDIVADERRARLARSVADNCVYSDPIDHCEGVDALIAHIEYSQRKVPGGHFRNGKFLEHHDQGLSEWTMLDAKETVIATGISYARFGPDGRLTQIAGFSELEQS